MADISKLIVGDTLIVVFSANTKRAMVIDRISPTGRVTAGGYIFKPNGRMLGDQHMLLAHAEPFTSEAWNAYTSENSRKQLARALSQLNWNGFDMKTLQAVYALLPESKSIE